MQWQRFMIIDCITSKYDAAIALSHYSSKNRNSIMSELITLYHNPACSKSRACLSLLEAYSADHNCQLVVRDYQLQALDLQELTLLATQLQDEIHSLLRPSESALNPAQLTPAAIIQILSDQPELLQRPIVVWRNRAMIARPPESVLQFLAN